jgi:hypothetical protein
MCPADSGGHGSRARLVSEPLQLDLPEPHTHTIRAAAICRDRQFSCLRIAVSAQNSESRRKARDFCVTAIPFWASSRFFSALVSLLSFRVRSRASLELEVVALRHQVAVLRRQRSGRLRLFCADRLLWVWLYRIWPRALHAMVLVKPATVVQWHRRGFRPYWRWRSRSRQIGRPKTSTEIRQLIRQMSMANPIWGAPRIHGELLMLGIEVSQATSGDTCRDDPRSPPLVLMRPDFDLAGRADRHRRRFTECGTQSQLNSGNSSSSIGGHRSCWWLSARQHCRDSHEVVGEHSRADHNSKRSGPSARQRFMPRPRNSTEMRPSIPARKR